jgi:uncharacterized protein (TIGR02646 family)
MIKRIRNLVDEPQSLRSEKARRELQKAEEHYDSGSTEPFKRFNIYRSEDVKVQLEKLFYGKCAYCESDYKTSGEINVEHFRPKGRIDLVNGRRLIPGYWWLAAKWSNLLPSCRNCNIVHNYDIGGMTESLGKGNFFPLPVNDNLRHVPVRGSERFELPLLINPSEEDPQKFIYFENSIIDKYSIVKARDTDEHIRLKGEASKKYYALNRPPLVKTRTEEIMKLYNVLNGIEDNIEDLLESNNIGQRRKYIKRINRNLKTIFDVYLNKKQPYFQAKFTYFMNWLQQFPEDHINKLLKYIEKTIL